MSRCKFHNLHLLVEKCASLAHLRAFFADYYQVSFSKISKEMIALLTVTSMNWSFPGAGYWSKTIVPNGSITVHQEAFWKPVETFLSNTNISIQHITSWDLQTLVGGSQECQTSHNEQGSPTKPTCPDSHLPFKCPENPGYNDQNLDRNFIQLLHKSCVMNVFQNGVIYAEYPWNAATI